MAFFVKLNFNIEIEFEPQSYQKALGNKFISPFVCYSKNT